MDVKSRAKQVFGAIVFLVGCLVLLAILRAVLLRWITYFLIAGDLGGKLWNAGGVLLVTGIGVYLVGAGLRFMNARLIKQPKFGWGKILFGSTMLYVQVGSFYHLVPDGPIPTFKASNPTQATSMMMTSVALCFIFAYLIFRGLRAGLSRPEPQPEIQVRR